jgi:hypothetical protein
MHLLIEHRALAMMAVFATCAVLRVARHCAAALLCSNPSGAKPAVEPATYSAQAARAEAVW